MQKYLLLLLTIIIVHTSNAQKKERKGEFYISWGYNKEYYTLSNVTINQPA